MGEKLRRDRLLGRLYRAAGIDQHSPDPVGDLQADGPVPGQRLFTEDSWIAVLLGQRKWPESYDPLVQAFDVDESRRFLASVRDVIHKTARAMPTHQQFIDHHCKAAPPEMAAPTHPIAATGN